MTKIIEVSDVHGNTISIKKGDNIKYALAMWKDGKLVGHHIVPAKVIRIDTRRKDSLYIEGDGFLWWIVLPI